MLSVYITTSREIEQEIKNGSSTTVIDRVKKGTVKHMVYDRRIRDERDTYISYAVDDDDWRDDCQAWDDVSGRSLDPEMVTEARTEEIE